LAVFLSPLIWIMSRRDWLSDRVGGEVVIHRQDRLVDYLTGAVPGDMCADKPAFAVNATVSCR
jgi:hypothetical protein